MQWWGRALLVAVSLAGSEMIAMGQELPTPFQALQPAAPAAPRHHRLFATASVYADKIGADLDESPTGLEGHLYDGVYFGVTPSLQYLYVGNRILFTVATGTTINRYAPGQVDATRFFQSMRMTTGLTEHTDMTVRAVVLYSPFYSFDLSQDPQNPETPPVVPSDEQLLVARRRNLNVDVGGEWRYRGSPQSTWTIDGGLTKTAFFGEGVDLLSPRVGFRFTHSYTPNFGVQFGYGFRDYEYEGAPRLHTTTHDLRTGIGYSKLLPLGRPTRVGFDVGGAAIRTASETKFDVTGGAYLTREISRDWSAVLYYRRGMVVRDGLDQPLFLFGDTIAATLTGRLSRRLASYTTGTYVRGSTVVDPIEEHTRWWSASTVMTWQIGGPFAAFGEGTYISQRFSADLGPFIGLPTSLDRYSFTAGLIMILPLVR